MSFQRIDGRKTDELRPITIEAGVVPYAEGSAEVTFGKTKLLVTASVEKEIPKWMSDGTAQTIQKGWITAEYGMLPRSTHTRNKREAAQGKQGGRTLEIQRLIGRALRAAVDLSAIPGITIRIDCDVLCADGGTRTAAISGGWVALAESLRWCKTNNLVERLVPVQPIAAISVGMVAETPLVDLCYEEDSHADFDLNIIHNKEHQLIEIQGTAENRPLRSQDLLTLLDLAKSGTSHIFEIQHRALR